MKSIYKYPVPIHQPLPLPKGAKVLSVGTQDGQPHLWAEVEVDASTPTEMRNIVPVPTGGEVPEGGTFLGSCHGVQGWMVFHIYEVK